MELTEAKLLENNEENYDRLMTVIEASLGMLALLIVSCEQRAFREEIIKRYETELSPEIGCYRVQLDQQEPSLRAALATLVKQNAGLDQAQMVVTVTGISELMDIRLNEEKSPLERFFGYLQWTREGLRAFPFPIILWVTPAILKRMSLAAPDFWSWRTGVFRFVATETVEVAVLDWQPVFDNREVEINQSLPIAELEKQINQIKAKKVASLSLVTLYDRLGQAYVNRIYSGNSKNLQSDINRAIAYFNKAIKTASFQKNIKLKNKLNLSINTANSLKRDISNSLMRLGDLYLYIGRNKKARVSYQKALQLAIKIGDKQGESDSLSNLGSVYNSLGEYQMAIAFYQQSLEIRRRIGDKKGEDICLSNLGSVYNSLGEYQKAIDFYQQSLYIRREARRKTGNREGEAIALGNLGNVYRLLGEYQRAITFQQLSLDIAREIGNKKLEANSLGNLGLILKKLNQNNDALEAFRHAHQLFQEMGLNEDAQFCNDQINSLMA